MAASGAGVLQLRSVEYARNHGVPIHCRSSFDDGPGTFVIAEEQTMERPLVTAVTHSTDEARITLTGLPDLPGIAGTGADRARRGERERRHDHPERARRPTARAPTCPSPCRATTLPRATALLGRCARSSASARSQADEDMGKVSVVGAGMKSHPGVAAKTFTVLGEAGVNIEMISTSPIKISCVIREEQVETAVRELHTAFELGEDAVLPRGRRGRPPAGGAQ